MPAEEYVWLPHQDILSFEEMDRLVDVFVGLGVNKVRLTGGEPLLRPDLPALVRRLARKPVATDIALTTNGVLLAEHAGRLRAAGLSRVTISLDTLRPDRFRTLSRRSSHAAVLQGIHAVPAAGFTGTKIDTVVMRGFNDDELADLIEFGRGVPAEVRFIEYMDVGGASGWTPDRVVPRDWILDILANRYGAVAEIPRTDSAPADRFVLPDGTTFGIISSTTRPFCGTCDRSRLTADGLWYRCLYASIGTDLRTPLRGGATSEHLRALVAATWRRRADRGAVERLASRQRHVLVSAADLRQDPHLEMHTRGG
jgi:cyclic pyranopterin phosphate synthase